MTAKRERALDAASEELERHLAETHGAHLSRHVLASVIDAYLEVVREPSEDEVRVGMACVVDEDGHWFAVGSSRSEPEDLMGWAWAETDIPAGAREHWIEATVQRPKAETVEGEVTE